MLTELEFHVLFERKYTLLKWFEKPSLIVSEQYV